LSSSTWIAIYMPFFIIFFIILPKQREMHKLIIQSIKKRKGVIIMINEVIKKYIGKNCKISAGSYGNRN